MLNLSKPTRDQLIRAVEHAIVVGVGAFVVAWAKQPDPFTRAAVLGAWGVAFGAVYGLAKGFVTNL